MKNMLEKTVEFISGEGGISVAIRPLFPFAAEGFRIREQGKVEIFGQGKIITLDVPDDIQDELGRAEQIDLCEFPADGMKAVRELILSRS